MRSRFDMRFQSLRETFEDARSSSRPRLPRLSAARSALDERPLAFPRRVSAARSRFDERDSFLDAAVSRPPRFADFEGADFAAVFFDAAAAFFAGAAFFFEAACAPFGLNKKIAETASAIRQGNRNFRVIEPSSLSLKIKPKRPTATP
jgi:hypothetical protein